MVLAIGFSVGWNDQVCAVQSLAELFQHADLPRVGCFREGAGLCLPDVSNSTRKHFVCIELPIVLPFVLPIVLSIELPIELPI